MFIFWIVLRSWNSYEIFDIFLGKPPMLSTSSMLQLSSHNDSNPNPENCSTSHQGPVTKSTHNLAGRKLADKVVSFIIRLLKLITVSDITWYLCVCFSSLRKVCHKNVVQIIGACTKPPNLSIVTGNIICATAILLQDSVAKEIPKLKWF